VLKRNKKIRCAEFLDGIETGLEQAGYRRFLEPNPAETLTYSPDLQELEECDPSDLLEVVGLKN
jgi:hypothetical protein